MTIVTIGENSIEISGHATKAIVCHGISAIGNMVANYVQDNGWGKVTERDGYLNIYDVDKACFDGALFEAMICALKDIEREYPENLTVIRR